MVKKAKNTKATNAELPDESALAEVRQLIIPCQVWCPYCGAKHVDEDRGNERWNRRAHTTHRCTSCGLDFDVYVIGAD